MALALRLGLDSRTAHDVICASSGGSWMFADRMPRVLQGDYSTKAAVHILAKDMGLLLDTAAEAHFPTPIAAVARQAYLATMALGHADEDDSAVIKSYAKAAGVELP
jgi:3-hydroxyisobutyrate dehydrogenase-like beta-hydroxyacid dehydrogenase